MLLLLFITIFWFSVLQGEEMITVYPVEYPEALSNPLKGFRPDDNSWSQYQYPTVVRDYIRWNEIENDSNDDVDKIINFCNDKWTGFPEANIKVIPRVYIDWDDNPGNEYWPEDLETGDWYSQEFKDRVVNLIYKLGEAWDNDPRVAWVQTGIIGYWGEQENPVGVDEGGWVERMGEAFENAFPNKLLVVRNQNYWESEGYEWGVYWDSFAHPGQTSGSWTRIRNSNANGRYLTHPVEGEVAYNWGEDVLYPVIGSNPDATLSTPEYYNYLIDVIRELHCSALGWIASYNPSDPNITTGAIEAQKAFGYRFVINEFSCPVRTDPGGTLDINFKVINIGSAPFYENWPLAFVLIDESTHQIVWTELLPGYDITTWHPGHDYDYNSRTYLTPAMEHEINATVTIPANFDTGQYMAGITILEPYSRTPGVFFAIQNFLKESQSQPLCRIGIGQDIVGSHEIDPNIFDDPLLEDNRSYTLQWNGPTYMLTMSATTGGSISPGSGIYPENQKVRLKATADLGYEFSGWSGDFSGSENPVTITIDEDKSIIANFISVPTYGLTINVENGTVSLDPPGGVYNEGTVVKITLNPDLGYLFTGWSGDLTGSENPATITMDEDKTVTANFTSAPIYTLTTSAAGGSIALDPAGPQYTEGTVVEVEAKANPGYLFVGWSGDPLDYASYINPNFITMDSDKNIVADFMQDPTYDVLLKNGDFSQKQEYWSPQIISPADATFIFDNKELEVDIHAVSDQAWHINILQQGIELETDKTYTLTFDAKAETDKIINAQAQYDHDPWTASVNEEVNITSSWQTFSVTWLYELPTASNKVGFFFGTDTTDVWIDNVSLITTATNLDNDEGIILPQQTQLAQNYPNPFNSETTIPYRISELTHVKVVIYNSLGQRVATLLDEQQSAGLYSVKWQGRNDNGRQMASGLYIYRLETNETVQMKKFILLQ